MKLRSQRLVVVAALAAGSLAWGAVAEAQTSAEKTAAEALFGEGKRLMDQGKFNEACPKFADSQKLDPGVGTLLNLARCYQKNGQTASAWTTYREAAGAARSAGQPDRENMARKEAAALEPTLPKLTVSVAPENASIADLLVKMDGAVLPKGLWGVPAPVDPGAHQIEASAPGKKTFSQKAQVSLKSSSTVTIPALSAGSGADVATAGSAPAGASSDTSVSVGKEGIAKSSQGPIGLVVAGVGVAAMAAGGLIALSAKAAYNDVPANQCDAANVCDDTGFAAKESARDKANVATIIFGAGAAALVGGGILFLTAPSSSRASASLGVGPSQVLIRGSF